MSITQITRTPNPDADAAQNGHERIGTQVDGKYRLASPWVAEHARSRIITPPVPPGDVAVDVFYVDRAGKKMTDEDAEGLRQHLIKALNLAPTSAVETAALS